MTKSVNVRPSISAARFSIACTSAGNRASSLAVVVVVLLIDAICGKLPYKARLRLRPAAARLKKTIGYSLNGISFIAACSLPRPAHWRGFALHFADLL